MTRREFTPLIVFGGSVQAVGANQLIQTLLGPGDHSLSVDAAAALHTLCNAIAEAGMAARRLQRSSAELAKTLDGELLVAIGKEGETK